MNRGLGALFEVKWQDLPIDVNSGITGQMLFDQLRDDNRIQQQKLLGEKKVMAGNLSGREFKYELPADRIPGGGIEHERYFLSGKRLYHVFVRDTKSS